jgi:hypothetical protein
MKVCFKIFLFLVMKFECIVDGSDECDDMWIILKRLLGRMTRSPIVTVCYGGLKLIN